MKQESKPIKIDRRLTGAYIIDEPLQQVSSKKDLIFRHIGVISCDIYNNTLVMFLEESNKPLHGKK